MTNSKGINALANLSTTTQFPPRPGHGTLGKKIVVYANYFKLIAPPNLSLTRYNVEVSPPATGKKLGRIFQLLLELPNFAGVATEWKSMIISTNDLNLPAGYTVQIPYKKEGEDEPLARAITYNVRVITPLTYLVSDLVKFLSSESPGPPYTQKAEVIQMMNAVFGHYPQAHPEVGSIGQNRHFSLDRSQANAHNIRVLGGGLESLRGYFLSVRPATGGLLLNVNVTHGVFFEPDRLDKLFPKLGTGNKITLAKKLNKLRVRVIHLPAKKGKKNQDVPRIKSICGFALTTDGRSEEHPPRVTVNGAGPTQVSFWLSDTPPATAPAAAAAGSKTTGKNKKPGGSQAGGLPANQYITVYDYFQIKYPHIQISDRNPVVNVGNKEHPMYLPAEVCVVLPGQPIGRRLSPLQTQEMITFACRKPWENANSIVGDGRAVLGLNPADNSISKAFGIQVGSSLVTVAARVLTPPQIKYKKGKQETAMTPRFGSWNMMNVQFHTGSNLGQWTYIYFQSNRGRGDNFSEGELRNTVNGFRTFLNSSGINAGGFISTPPPPTVYLYDGENARNDMIIRDIFRKFFLAAPAAKPRFVLCVLPYNDVALYNSIKTVGDTKAGIHTVCVVGSKFMKTNRQEQYFGNVSLKFNLKAGGINHTLDHGKLGIISEGKTMVVGLDVTHPSPGSKEGAPSVAGIVASVDKWLGQWPADFNVQLGKKEMVAALESMMISRLNVWKKRNGGALPVNIIMYRDGVSEGQYQLVLDEELPLIRNACRQLYPPDATKQGFPKVSIIICGKRHHTRFYPTAEKDADRSSNCEPGTIVDRGVTEVGSWDFFLQAHCCLQGTARSAHYYVILDEIFRGIKPTVQHKSAADALEELTHSMSHLFGRATKAVSLCPPAYYADLLCTRLRCYLSDQFDPQETSATPSVASGATGATGSKSKDDPIAIVAALKDSMFYI
ncbi:QDE2 protein [Leptodontidium sp. MPI-SDFR-AT-0119]|nr:QDE2 protein [Leptodontidium sp. MPI-SDFR-AT-0119]